MGVLLTVFLMTVPLLIVLVIVKTVRAARANVRARAAALAALAERTGWAFREEVEFGAIPDLDRFELFRQGGRTRKLRNLLTSPPGDVRAVVFDFQYTVSTGKSSHTVVQTVFYVTSDALHVPVFSLRPEHFLHGIATMFGYQDIDVADRPAFSDAFLLRGADETSVRDSFTDEVCEFFEGRRGVCAAGQEHELLYWRAGKLAAPEEIEALTAQAYDLADRFVKAGS